MISKDLVEKTFFSIVVVTFNNIQSIKDCLSSLAMALEGFKSELFIIDNASQDKTPDWLREHKNWLAELFSTTRVIFNNSNTGFTWALNQGLEKASGDFILILNPDVILQPDTITTLLPRFKKEKQIGVLAPQLRHLNGDIQPSCRRFPRRRDVFFEISGLSFLFSKSSVFNYWRMPHFDFNKNQYVDQPQGAFLLTKSDVLSSVGLFDNRFVMFFSDVDWCRRVIKAGWRIQFCPDTYVLHEKGASIYQKRPQMILSSHRSFVDYFKKYEHSILEKIGTRIVHLLLLIVITPRLFYAYYIQKK